MRILPLIEKINTISDHKDIVFAWVPGHVGIDGNDDADHLAKEAAYFDPPPSYAPLPHLDFKSIIRGGNWNERKNLWSIRKTKLNKVMPELRRRKPVTSVRKYESLITRLRIGHTSYTHSHLLKGEPPPFCVGCDTAISVEHILLKCIDFSAVREKYFKVNSMNALFNIVEQSRIVAYIKEIGLLGHL